VPARATLPWPVQLIITRSLTRRHVLTPRYCLDGHGETGLNLGDLKALDLSEMLTSQDQIRDPARQQIAALPAPKRRKGLASLSVS